MRKKLLVFAYIFALFFSGGCSILPVSNKSSIYKAKDVKYAVLGDYNGDNKKEYAYIYKDDNNMTFIKLTLHGNSYSKELPVQYDNYIANAVDINHDKKDDLVLYLINENQETVYIYSFDKSNITLIFSSDALVKNFNLKKNTDNYILSYDKYNQIIDYTGSYPLSMAVSNLDINYDDSGGPLIELVCYIKKSDSTVYSVYSTFDISTDNKICLKEINIIPYDDITALQK